MTTGNEQPKIQPEMQAASQEAKAEEKPVKVEAPKGIRIFVYDGREFSDPDPEMTTDDVRLYYATFFPELANAEVLAAVARPSKEPAGLTEQVTEFKRRTGTKGAKKPPEEKPAEINKCWNCEKPTMVQIEGAKPGWLKCTECGTTDYKPVRAC